MLLAKSLSRWKQPLALIWVGRWDTATGSTAQTRPPIPVDVAAHQKGTRKIGDRVLIFVRSGDRSNTEKSVS
jgi:hypothetical protein